MAYRGERRALPLAVKVPCHVPWDDMVGDGAVRFCLTCKKDVHDLTAMPEEDIAALLEKAKRPCIRFYVRPDGRMLDSKCRLGREPRRMAKTFVVSATAALLGVATASIIADAPRLAEDEPLSIEHEGIPARAARHDELFEEIVMGERNAPDDDQ